MQPVDHTIQQVNWNNNSIIIISSQMGYQAQPLWSGFVGWRVDGWAGEDRWVVIDRLSPAVDSLRGAMLFSPTCGQI